MVLSESDIWEEWKRLTRFLECSKIAFQRELTIWNSLEVGDPSSVRITTANGLSKFSVTASDHIETLKDEELLYFIVLTYSYSLCECYARMKLGLGEGGRLTGGIETWGAELLKKASGSWGDVLGGLGGVLEVAVARNFMAHGSREVGESTIERFRNANQPCPWGLGDVVVMSYDVVEMYRSRLKSLMRVCNG